MLRSRRTRRELPLDVRVPDPAVAPVEGTDPEHEALLGDAVGLALVVVLETLSPAERLAFVLHDMFAVPFEEIAAIVERSPDLRYHRALINGATGLVSLREGRPFSVGAMTISNGKIVEIDILGDPERLANLDLTILHD